VKVEEKQQTSKGCRVGRSGAPGRVDAAGPTCGCPVGCSTGWRHCLWFLTSTCPKNSRKELGSSKRANEASNASYDSIWRYQKAFCCALFAVGVVQQGATEFALVLEPEVRSCLSLC